MPVRLPSRYRSEAPGTMSWQIRTLFGLLLVTLAVLQYRLWFGEGSQAEVRQLERDIAQQKHYLELRQERNAALSAEIAGLKDGLAGVEARARNELGMIRKGEVFYQLVPASGPPRRE